jgi:hypothetical protein
MRKISANEKSPFSPLRKLAAFAGVVLSLFLIGNSGTVNAVPSFARQTGLSCKACHNVFPELNYFGRQFKLNGYTMVTTGSITQTEPRDSSMGPRTSLNLLKIAPLAAMFQAGYTNVARTVPGTQNSDLEFPQQLSLFYAGQISPHLGAFVQLTLDDGSGTFGMDNTDIRYSNTGKGDIPFLYGITLNNNPTVQDVWNSTPAWGYPYSGSGVAPTPDAGTIIENLGGTVAGLGVYTLINNAFYLEITGYRTAQLGAALPPDNTVSGALKGIAPYWRVAVEHQWARSYLEAGTYGIASQLYPSGISGNTDNYTDIAFDLQYRYQLTNSQFTLHSSFINEKQTLNATFGDSGSENLTNRLNKFSLDASLFMRQLVNFTLAYFNYSGTSDNLLYGYRLPSPDSNGFMAQIDYLPWENTKISLQYTTYGKFNGSSSNYDGTNRNASNNNTIYLQVWVLF